MNDQKETMHDLWKCFGRSQKELGEFLGIPHRSIQNWAEDKKSCPQYVIDLAAYKLRKEKKLESKITVRATGSGVIDLFDESEFYDGDNEGRRVQLSFDDVEIYKDEDLYENSDSAIADCKNDYREQIIEAFPNSSDQDVNDALIEIMLFASSQIDNYFNNLQ